MVGGAFYCHKGKVLKYKKLQTWICIFHIGKGFLVVTHKLMMIHGRYVGDIRHWSKWSIWHCDIAARLPTSVADPDHCSWISPNAACQTPKKCWVKCIAVQWEWGRRWVGWVGGQERKLRYQKAGFDLAQLGNVKSSIFIPAPFFPGRKYQIRRRPT